MNPLAFPPLSRAPEQTYQTQLINSQIGYQPFPLYYNVMVPGVQQNYQQQIILPQNLKSIQNNSQQQAIQQQFFSQVIQQPNEQKQEFKNVQSLNTVQQRVILISQLLQISPEEVASIISDNLCVCCKNSLTNKNFQESHSESIVDKEKLYYLSTTQISSLSQKEFHSNLANNQILQDNKNQFDQQSQINRHQDTLFIQFDKNQNKFIEQNASKSYRTTISNEINQAYFEGLNGFQQESSNEQENESDCDKEDSSSKLNFQQNINHLINSCVEKASSNSTQSFYTQIKVEAKEGIAMKAQVEDFSVQNDTNPEKKQAQYALLKKPISKQSKDIQSNKKKLNSSEVQFREIDTQQQPNSTNSPLLSTSLQLQKPQSQTSKIYLNQNLSSYKINEMSEKYAAQVSYDENDEQSKQKKEYQNDSNYTKNLLKGFRRVVIKNYGSNLEFITDFKNYFDSFSLNNEFILKLFSDSPYSVYFSEFLQTDPSWWMKEARIKDTDNQLEFFEICKRRQFSLIRTKRKKFIRPKLI